MRFNKKSAKRPIKSAMAMRNRRVMAETDIAEEAYDMLFEAEDVAELVAEVTGEDVEVTVDGDTVEFAVGDDTYVVEAEGDEETLEASRKMPRRARKVAASTRKPAGRTLRSVRRK